MKSWIDGRGNERCSVCNSKIEGGYCDCMLPETDTKIPMPKVKEPKQSITIGVNVDGLDEAMKKLNEMMEVCKKIDTLQQRIIKGADHIEKIANRLPRMEEKE